MKNIQPYQTGIQSSSSKFTVKFDFPCTDTLVVFIGLQPANSAWRSDEWQVVSGEKGGGEKKNSEKKVER